MLSPDAENQSLGIEQTVGQFALVSYLPNPLARFLDDLRLELTPGCTPHAHVTILPPRPLHGELQDILHQLAEDVRDVAPFRVEAGDIAVFDRSNVVYLSLASGVGELRKLYRSLNWGCLEYRENFPYEPHITMAQNIPPDEAPRLAALARERWARYEGPRGFDISGLSFVQHVALGIWTDVAVLPLAACEPVTS